MRLGFPGVPLIPYEPAPPNPEVAQPGTMFTLHVEATEAQTTLFSMAMECDVWSPGRRINR